MPERVDAMQRVRLAHTQALVDQLRRAGPLSRAELAERTGLSRTTVFEILTDLLARRVVIERDPAVVERRRRGRPSTTVSLNPAAGRIVGVDLNRTKINVVVANVAHEVMASGSRPIAVTASTARRATAAIGLIEELAGAHGIDLGSLAAIGLGLPGLVADPRRPAGSGKLTLAARWTVDRFRRHFGITILPDNNSRLAALAEATWGAARGADNVVYVRWAHGVGGGLVVDGRPVRGAHGAAGEIGHVTVDPTGGPCPCGGRGCLEQYIRTNALLADYAARRAPLRDSAELIERVLGGDPDAREVLLRAANRLSQVIAGAVVTLDPSLVVLGGDFAQLGDLVLDPVRRAIGQLAIPRNPRKVEVVVARLGDNDGALGGVAMVLQADGADARRMRIASALAS